LVTKASAATVTVTSTYVVPNTYIGVIRKTFQCTQKFIGRIPIIVSGGLAPYTITMTAKPVAYTGPTSFSLATAGTLNVDSLPAGAYTFTVQDNCTYSTTLNATVGAFAADFVSELVFEYPLMPAAYTTNCREVRIRTNYLTNTAHELYGVYGNEFYEVGFTYNATTQPASWQNPGAAANEITYQLGDDRDVFKQSNKYIAVWVRIKGTTCAYKVRDIRASTNTNIAEVSNAYINCDTVQVTHRLRSTEIQNFFCWPYQYCVVKPVTAPNDTIIPWSANITDIGSITTRMPYGSKIVYRDSKGNQYSYSIIDRKSVV
jgi:hypothetical protein